MMMNSQSQKIDLQLGELSVNIDPMLLRTFVTLSKSIQKQQEVLFSLSLSSFLIRLTVILDEERSERKRKYQS